MSDNVNNIKKVILSNDFAALYRIDYNYKFKNNDWRSVSREVYTRRDAACILLYNTEKQSVVLTSQFRMPVYLNTNEEGMSIEVCAGLIDAGETPLDCVLRETEEELGYCLPMAKKIMEIYMSPGAITEKTHLFIAEYTPEMKINAGGGLEELNDDDIEALKGSVTMPVALPSCSYFLSIPYTPGRKIIDAGLPLALASDYNPGSTPSGNMNFVVSTACIKMRLTPEEAINAATINGAYAMGISNAYGSITKGKKANLIITKQVPSYSYLPYSFGENLIENVIINGKLIE